MPSWGTTLCTSWRSASVASVDGMRTTAPLRVAVFAGPAHLAAAPPPSWPGPEREPASAAGQTSTARRPGGQARQADWRRPPCSWREGGRGAEVDAAHDGSTVHARAAGSRLLNKGTQPGHAPITRLRQAPCAESNCPDRQQRRRQGVVAGSRRGCPPHFYAACQPSLRHQPPRHLHHALCQVDADNPVRREGGRQQRQLLACTAQSSGGGCRPAGLGPHASMRSRGRPEQEGHRTGGGHV